MQKEHKILNSTSTPLMYNCWMTISRLLSTMRSLQDKTVGETDKMKSDRLENAMELIHVKPYLMKNRGTPPHDCSDSTATMY